ncbi:rhodanese-like domain-containing protein [Formosa sp. 3Alg 14/1]|uniref:rhodanese-like domain-containing protein n=1 Tax=Formosa sp. 3Alg 14/1 TaxID=3382190 RepID=UPI0039BDC595
MKNHLKYILILITVLCTNLMVSQEKSTSLSVDEFSKIMSEQPELMVVDVRTPEEFDSGHLEGAINYNWKSEDFNNQISDLDKSKEVLIYCRSGARSAKAAEKMRSEGFTTVYELKGGLIDWKKENMSVVVPEGVEQGMKVE